MKWIICKSCRGAGSRAPMRAICQECGGRGTNQVEGKPPTKAHLWRRVARLAGELMFASQHSMPFSSGHCKPPGAIRQLIRNVRSLDEVDGIDRKHHEKIIAKLEAALGAWEAAE